jgi:hypothetical protein
MTAQPLELVAPRRGILASLEGALSRDELFAGLYILGCANGLLGRFLQTVDFSDWTSSILTLDLNAIVLFACVAGVTAFFDGNAASREPAKPADLGVAAIFLALVVLPIYPLSWIAVTGLSLYIFVFANQASDRRRGAIILLALSVPMLWSRLMFALFANPILNVDASLVASILGTDRMGNMVRFADNSGYMVVLPACSSLANMSLAFLCWISITQWAKHRWSPADFGWSLLACASVITVNVTRISVMGLSHRHYDAIHNQWGDLVTNSIMLALMVTISVLGCRREIFSRI